MQTRSGRIAVIMSWSRSNAGVLLNSKVDHGILDQSIVQKGEIAAWLGKVDLQKNRHLISRHMQCIWLGVLQDGQSLHK